MGGKWEETGSIREHVSTEEQGGRSHTVRGRGECLKTGAARWYSAETKEMFALFNIQHFSDT